MDEFLLLKYVISALCLLVLLVFVTHQVLQIVRKRLSARWPWTQSSIICGRLSGPSGEDSSYELRVSYSYSVGGVTYTGTYMELCATESAAEGSLRSLQDMPPPVRYKPGNPSVSVMDPYRDAGLAYKGSKGESNPPISTPS